MNGTCSISTPGNFVLWPNFLVYIQSKRKVRCNLSRIHFTRLNNYVLAYVFRRMQFPPSKTPRKFRQRKYTVLKKKKKKKTAEKKKLLGYCGQNFFFLNWWSDWSAIVGDFVLSLRPRGLTFTWWGCCGWCFWHKPTEIAHSFSFCSCVCFCLYGPFNCISFNKFSRQVSVFSLCSSGPLSAL